MARLVLGPLLRYADAHCATVWVETDAPCEVEVLDHRARTFEISGHHYAIVRVSDLPPGQDTPYEVRLDGERVWPALEGFPPSLIRPPAAGETLRICFGSCRLSAAAGHLGADALQAMATRMRAQSPSEWPDLLLLLGDQVYADEPSDAMREHLASRRDPEVPPGETVADFEEYTALYREAWGQPVIRWLLSAVPSVMIFDDHDVHDDWNTSLSWVEDIRAKGWWDERIIGGFASYWIYQHLGNLAPDALDEDEIYDKVKDAGDGTEIVRRFAFKADREVAGARWSFSRDLGGVRIVMIDSRAARVLTFDDRSMIDDDEFEWLESRLTGDVEHLLVGTSLPLFLAPGIHGLEAWNEAVCDGAWGRGWAWLGEQIRRAADLEHWAAFGDSFRRLTRSLQSVAAGERGERPGSVVVLSGDVHHCYLAEVGFPRAETPAGGRAPVWQATCSPFRNPLSPAEQRIVRFGWSAAGRVIGGLMARGAGVPAAAAQWRLAHEAPFFHNQIGTLVLDGRAGTLKLERAITDVQDPAVGHLLPVFEHPLHVG